MATIKDVARRAGVSVGTVSNYLNKTKPVSRDAANRIKEAIDALHYTQNFSAKALKSNTYNDVGVILPNFDDPYYVQIFQGIESAFQNSSFFLNVAFSYDIPELEQNIVRNMLRKQICGLLLVTCQPNATAFYQEHFIRRNRPLVLIDRAIQGLNTEILSFDNRQAMFTITRNLLLKGFQNIFLMTGPATYTCEAACIQGFQEAYALEGAMPDPNAIIQIELNKEDAFRKTTALLRYRKPELLLTTSELSATGIIEGLRFLGYSIDDIPVITLGEDHWNEYTDSLATLSINRSAIKMGENAAHLLFKTLQAHEDIQLEGLNSDVSPTMRSFLGTRHSVVRPTGETLRVLMLDRPPIHTFCNLLKNFENAYGIHVEVTFCPHRDLYETIVGNCLGHSAGRYDVFMFDIPWLPSLASQRLLEDLSDLLESINTDTFLPGCLQYYSLFKGKYYGVPFLYAPQILYYRKDLFDDPSLQMSYEKIYGTALRPPMSFEEFNQVAEFFTNRTDAIEYGCSVPAAYSECLAPELYLRLWAYGSEIMDRYGKPKINNHNTYRAYTNFAKTFQFAKQDYFKANDITIVSDFLQGKTAMLMTYSPFMSDATDLRKSSMIGSIGYTYIPGKTSVISGWSFGVNRYSAHRNAAFAFLRWTCDSKVGNYFTVLGGQSAITSTYTNDEQIKLYPWLPLYYSSYQYTRAAFPPVQKNGCAISANAVDAVLCKWFHALIKKQCSVEDAVLNTQKELEKLMGEKP